MRKPSLGGRHGEKNYFWIAGAGGGGRGRWVLACARVGVLCGGVRVWGALRGAPRARDGAKGLRASASGSGSGAAEAARIMNDPSHPLHEAFMSLDHPNHRFANSEYDRLMGLR